MATPALKEKLLSLCLETPDYDEAKLVYADHLQEIGDPRGAFIAMQYGYEVFDAPEAKQQVKRLLRQHGNDFFFDDFMSYIPEELRDAMTAEIKPARYSRPSVCTYRKGFLYSLNFDGMDWTNVLQGEDINKMFSSPHMKFVRCLNPGQMESRHIEQLQGTSWKITDLDLEDCGTCSGEILAWLGNPIIDSITSLSLYDDHYIDDDIVAWISDSPRMKNLENLVLSRTSLSSDGCRSLVRSKYLRKVKYLDVGGCPISEDDVRYLKRSRFGKIELHA